MSAALDNLASGDVGERLRMARDTARVTQAAAAAALNVARTTIVAIEQGQRRIRLEELQALVGLYGTSVNALFRSEAVQVDLKPQFRRAPQGLESDEDTASTLLTDLVKAEVELEDLLGIQRARNLPPEHPLLPGDVTVQAEQDAFELRQLLGLGMAPVHDLSNLLELQLGIRVYCRRLPTSISGLYAYDDAVGACMLLNANHPLSRRAQTGAHETGHVVATRRSPDIYREGKVETSREELYANAFGRAFLTPPRPVMSAFRDITAGSPQLTRRHVIVLASMFGVAREAMVRRLEELRLAKQGTWDWFAANGGITDEQARQVLGDDLREDAAKRDADRPVSLRLGLLAAEAWRRELLSEAQLARLLHLDRVELRQLVDACEFEGAAGDEPPRLPG